MKLPVLLVIAFLSGAAMFYLLSVGVAFLYAAGFAAVVGAILIVSYAAIKLPGDLFWSKIEFWSWMAVLLLCVGGTIEMVIESRFPRGSLLLVGAGFWMFGLVCDLVSAVTKQHAARA